MSHNLLDRVDTVKITCTSYYVVVRPSDQTHFAITCILLFSSAPLIEVLLTSERCCSSSALANGPCSLEFHIPELADYCKIVNVR